MERIFTSREKFAEDWGTEVPGPDVERVVFYGNKLGERCGVLEYVFPVDTVAVAEVKELERMFGL